MSASQPNFESEHLQIPEEEQDWLEADLSLLEEFESYEWGTTNPLTMGQPIKFVPGVGLVVLVDA